MCPCVTVCACVCQEGDAAHPSGYLKAGQGQKEEQGECRCGERVAGWAPGEAGGMWGPSSQGLLQAGSLICHLTSKWIPSGPSSCPMKVLNTQEEWEGEGREGRNGGEGGQQMPIPAGGRQWG